MHKHVQANSAWLQNAVSCNLRTAICTLYFQHRSSLSGLDARAVAVASSSQDVSGMTGHVPDNDAEICTLSDKSRCMSTWPRKRLLFELYKAYTCKESLFLRIRCSDPLSDLTKTKEP